MARALIQTDGAGQLKGVWVTGADGPDPDVAFLNELDQLDAEMILGHAASIVHAQESTWELFIEELFQRQNHITVQRIQTETDLNAAELLADVRALWPNWGELT